MLSAKAWKQFSHLQNPFKLQPHSGVGACYHKHERPGSRRSQCSFSSPPARSQAVACIHDKSAALKVFDNEQGAWVDPDTHTHTDIIWSAPAYESLSPPLCQLSDRGMSCLKFSLQRAGGRDPSALTPAVGGGLSLGSLLFEEVTCQG